jgi:hypothetical protein
MPNRHFRLFLNQQQRRLMQKAANRARGNGEKSTCGAKTSLKQAKTRSHANKALFQMGFRL